MYPISLIDDVAVKILFTPEKKVFFFGGRLLKNWFNKSIFLLNIWLLIIGYHPLKSP